MYTNAHEEVSLEDETSIDNITVFKMIFLSAADIASLGPEASNAWMCPTCILETPA